NPRQHTGVYGVPDEANRYAEAWLGDLPGQTGWGMERGLFTVQCLADTLAAGALEEPALPGGWAWVERLIVLQLRRKDIDRFFAAPLPPGFDGTLQLARKPLSHDLGRALARSEAAASLTGLDLAQCHLGQPGLEA